LAKENIFCTEFSEYGRHQIENWGIKCVPKDIRELSGQEYEKCADVICLFQVLEHMDGLDVLFEKLNWLLKPGGSIFIAVPNQNMIEFNELNGALLDMPPNHIGRWNRICFEIIGSRHNLTLEDYQVENSDLALLASGGQQLQKAFTWAAVTVLFMLIRSAYFHAQFDFALRKIVN
jgi:SAM-dependent methyltransferase